MLSTLLTGLGHPKFVLIKDSLEGSGRNFIRHILQSVDKNTCFLAIFEGCFARAHNLYGDICLGDFVTFDSSCNVQTKFRNSTKGRTVILLDSLVHFVANLSPFGAYELLNELKQNDGIQQVVTVLHKDLILKEEDYTKIFEELSDLVIDLNSTSQLEFKHIKSNGKVVRMRLNYEFLRDDIELETKPIQKPKEIPHVHEETKILDNLTTFKIDLTADEKANRDQLILPYLPKELKEDKEGASIHYEFDEQDDWDEEDPDDDLDI